MYIIKERVVADTKTTHASSQDIHMQTIQRYQDSLDLKKCVHRNSSILVWSRTKVIFHHRHQKVQIHYIQYWVSHLSDLCRMSLWSHVVFKIIRYHWLQLKIKKNMTAVIKQTQNRNKSVFFKNIFMTLLLLIMHRRKCWIGSRHFESLVLNLNILQTCQCVH